MEKESVDKKEINLRSEEVQEVLGGVPSWILRWGITLLFVFMVVLLIGSSMFKYPDIVTTSMTLTGTVPVGKVVAKSSGKVNELYVKNNQEVEAGDYLAVLDNTASTKDMVELKSYLSVLAKDSVPNLPLPSSKWVLGELQNEYIQLYLILKQRQRNPGSLQTELETVLMRMTAAVSNWEKTYALVAPVGGSVAFTNIWSANQLVSAGEVVFNIIPAEKGELVGKAMLPIGQSGKVKEGQTVNVHFDSFPDNEYGVVKGQVNNISSVPNNGFYMVDIVFPDGLLTTYKKNLPSKLETLAKADIITEDVSLLERFFMPLKKLLSTIQ